MKNSSTRFIPILFIVYTLFSQAVNAADAKSHALLSPDKNLQLNIMQTPDGDFVYSLTAGGVGLIDASPLGYKLETGAVVPSKG